MGDESLKHEVIEFQNYLKSNHELIKVFSQTICRALFFNGRSKTISLPEFIEMIVTLEL